MIKVYPKTFRKNIPTLNCLPHIPKISSAAIFPKLCTKYHKFYWIGKSKRKHQLCILRHLPVSSFDGMTQIYSIFKELSDGLWRSTGKPLVKRLRIILKIKIIGKYYRYGNYVIDREQRSKVLKEGKFYQLQRQLIQIYSWYITQMNLG